MGMSSQTAMCLLALLPTHFSINLNNSFPFSDFSPVEGSKVPKTEVPPQTAWGKLCESALEGAVARADRGESKLHRVHGNQHLHDA